MRQSSANKIIIPPMYKEASISDFDKKHQAVVMEWLEKEEPGFLTLLGGVGKGKTHLLYAIYRHLYKQFVPLAVVLLPVTQLVRTLQYLRGQDIQSEYNDLVDELSGKEPQSRYAREERKWGNEIPGINLLLLDDLGVEKRTEFAMSVMGEILSERQAWGKATVITSNLDLDELDRLWGSRIASRLAGGMVIEFKGKDWRQKCQ